MKSYFRSLPVILVLLVFVSCSNENQDTNQTENDQNTDSVSVEELLPDPGFHFDGIIVGSGVRSRESPSTTGKVISLFEQGKLVKVVDEMPERVKIGNDDSCDDYGYKWYLVEEKDDEKRSWVYGKFLFIVNPEYKAEKITINDEEFMFYEASDVSYGPADEEGLTGCDGFYIPFFVREGEDKGLVIHYDPETTGNVGGLGGVCSRYDDGTLFLVGDSEGGADDITEIEPAFENGKEYLKMEIAIYYQDGGKNGDLLTAYSNGKFSTVRFEITSSDYD